MGQGDIKKQFCITKSNTWANVRANATNHLGGRFRRKPASHLPHQLAVLPLRPGHGKVRWSWKACSSGERRARKGRVGRVSWGYLGCDGSGGAAPLGEGRFRSVGCIWRRTDGFSGYHNILCLALEVSVTPIARIHLVFGSVVIIVPCMLQFRPMR
jgi:hypothetical protein